MARPRPIVLYIVAGTRSGSSLLQTLIASRVESAVQVGELRRIRDFVITNEACSCGLPFGSCPFWTQRIRNVEWEDTVDLRCHLEGVAGKAKYVLAMILLALGLRSWAGRIINRGVTAANNWGKMIDEIGEVCNAELIIDNSKVAMHYLHLKLKYGPMILPVFLVRDGYAATWSKHRRTGITLKRAARQWVHDIITLLAARILTARSSRLIRYEELCANPAKCVDSILSDTLGLDPYRGARNVELFQHVLGGSPSVDPGKIPNVQFDERWRSAITVDDNRKVSRALALGLFNRCLGYHGNALVRNNGADDEAS